MNPCMHDLYLQFRCAHYGLYPSAPVSGGSQSGYAVCVFVYFTFICFRRSGALRRLSAILLVGYLKHNIALHDMVQEP